MQKYAHTWTWCQHQVKKQFNSTSCYSLFILGTRVVEGRIPDWSTDPYPMNYWRTDLGVLVALFTHLVLLNRYHLNNFVWLEIFYHFKTNPKQHFSWSTKSIYKVIIIFFVGYPKCCFLVWTIILYCAFSIIWNQNIWLLQLRSVGKKIVSEVAKVKIFSLQGEGDAQSKEKAMPKIYEKGYAQMVTSITGNSLQGEAYAQLKS